VFRLKDSAEVITGEVYTFERCSDTLVICENKVGSNLATYRFLKSSSIDLSTVQLSGEHIPPEPLPPVSQATLDRIRERETIAVQREMAKASLIASGVTREAQLIFNGLAKTMRCRWDGQDILLEYDRSDGGVRITSPYTSDKVAGKGEELVARVRKVLEGERAKLTR